MAAQDDPVAAVAALNLPLRRKIYDFVASSPDAVTRDDAATAVGVARSVAAFNLDKLAAVGLVDVEYRRAQGRGGPGAGRPAKWYRRATSDVAVSLPPREYGTAAAILADVVARSAGEPVTVDTVRAVAREHGHRLAAEDGAILELLAAHGYEPTVHGHVVEMANCPFHALVDEHRDLVCNLNEALLTGIAERAGLSPDAARLDPAPGRCCVTLRVSAKER